MPYSLSRTITRLLSFITILTLLLSPSYADTPTQKTELVIGVLSNKAQKHIRFSQPLADYLAKELVDFGIEQASVKVTNNISQIGNWLDNGQIDLFSDTVFTALHIQDDYNAEIMLRRWKKGIPEYRSIFFTQKDTGIKNLDELVGKRLALEDRDSTSGYFLPLSTLIERGYQLSQLTHPSDPVPANTIGYIITADTLNKADELSLSAWVYRNKVDAAAFSDHNWNDPEDMPLSMRKKLDIIHESSAFPRSVQLIRSDLDPVLKEQIKVLLLNAHLSEQGRHALEAFQDTKKFDHFTEENIEAVQLADNLRILINKYL